MAPFPNVNKVVLAQIQIYRGGKGLVLAGRLKDKQIRGFHKLLMRHHKPTGATPPTVTQTPGRERGVALGKKKKTLNAKPHLLAHIRNPASSYPTLPIGQVLPGVSQATSHVPSAGAQI